MNDYKTNLTSRQQGVVHENKIKTFNCGLNSKTENIVKHQLDYENKKTCKLNILVITNKKTNLIM